VTGIAGLEVGDSSKTSSASFERLAHQPAHGAAVESGSDLERMIARGGCAEAFYALELCMGESGRAWAAFQPQVRALRACRDATSRAAGVAGAAGAAAADTNAEATR
jgi:hypothetical protein